MTKEEYKMKLTALAAEHERKVSALRKEYAQSNNPYKVGDVIEDHIGKGKILNMYMSIATPTGTPEMRYNVEELRKDGSPRKRPTQRIVSQSNIKQ